MGWVFKGEDCEVTLEEGRGREERKKENLWLLR